MENKKYVSPKNWTIAYGDYLSQCDDYEMQHNKIIKRDKVYKYTFYSLIGVVLVSMFFVILHVVSKM
ncbi:MAG: hypothetical protein V1773_16935 [bacterium]